MKCEFCKIWLPIIAILTVGFYVAYRFVPASALQSLHIVTGTKGADGHGSNPHVTASQPPDGKGIKLGNNTPLDKDKVRKPPSIQPQEIQARPTAEQYLLQGYAWLDKKIPSWLVAKPDQFKAVLLPLLLLMLLVAIRSRALYQGRIRSRSYKGYKKLYRAAGQLGSVDLAVIDQEIAGLTQLYRELAQDVSMPIAQMPALYSLCTHVNYTLNRLRERKEILISEPAILPETEELPTFLLMQSVENKLDRLAEQLGPLLVHAAGQDLLVETVEGEHRTTTQEHRQGQLLPDKPELNQFPETGKDEALEEKPEQQPVVASHASSKFASVTAWKNKMRNDKPVEEQQQPLPNHPEPSPLLETAVDKQQAGLARSISKFAGITFWKKKTHGNQPIDEPPQPLPIYPEPKPVVEAAADEPQLAKTGQQPNVLTQSIRNFSGLSFWKKKALDDQPKDGQEQPQPLSPQPEPSPLVETLEGNGRINSDDDSQYRQAQAIVRKHMLAGIALSAVPVPIVDVAALTGTQLNLLNSLSAHYGVAFNKERSKSILVALLSGALPTTVLMWLSSLTKIIPGIGTLGGGASLSATAGAVIYATGQVFIKHFEAGGELKDFDGKQHREYFQQALKDGLAVKAKETSGQIG